MKKMTLGKKNHDYEERKEGRRKEGIRHGHQQQEAKASRRTELKERRTLFAKHYQNEDRTLTMEISSEPVHYFDEETRTYEEIDNTFIEKGGFLSLAHNSFLLDLAQEVGSEELYSLSNKDHRLGFKYQGKKEAGRLTRHRSKARTSNQDKLTSKVVYEDVAPSVDLEYLVSGSRVKENIIIKERQETYEFEFELNITGLRVRLSEDERSLVLLDKEGKKKYLIPAPFMEDSGSARSNEVSYEFEEMTEGILKLLVTADSSWINDEERVFPVRIDPQVIVLLGLGELTSYEISITESLFGESSQEVKLCTGPGSISNWMVFIHHFMTINLGNYREHHIVKAELKIEVATYPDQDVIAIYDHDIPSLADGSFHLDDFSYDASQSHHYLTPKFNLENKTADITGLVDTWMTENRKIGGMVLRYAGRMIGSNPVPKTGSVSFTARPSLTITYQEIRYLPEYYRKQGKCMMVETFAKHEADFSDGDGTTGILTTYVDHVNSKVHQHFQVDNKIYLRSSLSVFTWSHWLESGQEYAEQLNNDLTVSLNQGLGSLDKKIGDKIRMDLDKNGLLTITKE